uniref:Uncharacterized protein n=1 Tax=Podoviridae sp. ctXBg1 TaxID=2827739 RepID=A0A8S5SR23_9CAUD|nr:MAG TPA: hypothetical protein [Podoviridae sp. ctXBg1]
MFFRRSNQPRARLPSHPNPAFSYHSIRKRKTPSKQIKKFLLKTPKKR